MKSCFFIGHREADERLLPRLELVVDRLIREEGVRYFYVGGYGGFDRVAAAAVRRMKQKYPDITLMLVLPRMKQASDDFRVKLYEGHILMRKGEKEKAEAAWKKMLENDAENWMAHSSFADAMVKAERYDEAVEAFKRAIELEKAPRYIDNWDSIGQICEIQRKWEEAAQAYEQVLVIYKEDWQSTEGYYVDLYRQKVLACRAKA